MTVDGDSVWSNSHNCINIDRNQKSSGQAADFEVGHLNYFNSVCFFIVPGMLCAGARFNYYSAYLYTNYKFRGKKFL